MRVSRAAVSHRWWWIAALVAILAVLLFSSAASGQDRHGRDHWRGAPPRWEGDIHRFHERDWHTWRGGRWIHGPHDGRLGWWWVVGGLWYFYPAPVYPYPNPYEPPPVELVSPSQNPLPPPTSYWYYCDAARAYYPYVAACPGGWRQVPAEGAAPPPR